jgi:uncharacterized protein YlxP (DUF503 family)
MVTGSLRIDLLLGDVHSLKDKRGLVRPLVADLRRRFSVSAAEVEHQDLHRRAVIGVAVVADSEGHCGEVLDACEAAFDDHPEVEVLEVHRVLRHDADS